MTWMTGINQVLDPSRDWPIHTRLTPRQKRINGHLEIIARMTQLSDAPLHIGHFLRVIDDESECRCTVERTERGTVHPDMSIDQILVQLSVYKWPSARPG
jgi:hypothetical protein